MSIEESVSISSSVRPRGWHSVQKPTHEVKEVTFDDMLDAINPLNHLPFVSQLTDNPISPVAKMVGGLLLGGPLGLAVSAINSVFEEANGRSVLGSVGHAAFVGEDPLSPHHQATKKYRSIADANKRHLHTWRA